MALSDRSSGNELYLLKSILNSPSQCSLGEDPKPKEMTGDDNGDGGSTPKTDSDDSPATSSHGVLGDGQRVARPKTSNGGRMLESRRQNQRTSCNQYVSVDDAGCDAVDRRQQMYRRVCVDEERAESRVARCPRSRGRSAPARRADYIAVHTNSLEQKYQELRDLLENQFLQEREELNRTLLKQTRQVMHKYRLAQSGYVVPRPTTAPVGRRRRPRAWRENDTQSTQTDESAQLRNTEDDIRLGEDRDHDDTFILIDGTKENGVSVTKHVTFVSADEGRAYRATTDDDMVSTDQQNTRRPGRMQRSRKKTRDNGETRRQRKQTTEGHSTADNVQQRRLSEDTSARNSDSSAESTGYKAHHELSDASNSPSTSPSRGSSNIGPLCDHHLKYSSNTKLIEWLRRKNRVYRQQVAEERKAARKKRREEEEELRLKEMKKEEAKYAMELWLKMKKSQERLLRRRKRTEEAFKLQQQLNSNIDNEVTLGTTVNLRSRDSRDGSSSARGKQYASSMSNIHSKAGKPKHVITRRNISTNNNSHVGDNDDVTVMPSAGNDRKCLCGFSGDPNVSPFIAGTRRSASDRTKSAKTEQTRPDSANRRLSNHNQRSKRAASSKAQLESSNQEPDIRQSVDSKRRNVTSTNRLHKVGSQQKSEEVKLTVAAGHEHSGARPDADNAEEVHTSTGEKKTSVSRFPVNVRKTRCRRIRTSHEEIIDKVHAENVINISTAGLDDNAEHHQDEESVEQSSIPLIKGAGGNDEETPQELGRTPRRPSSGQPRSSKRGRRLSFGTPAPPKPSASPIVGKQDPNVPTSGRSPRRGRPHNAKPTSAASSLSAPQSTDQKRPVTPKPKLPGTRPGYEKVKYQQRSWESFSEHVWKQVNEDESDDDSAERPEPQGSDKLDDNPSTVSEPRDVTSACREITSPVTSFADTDTNMNDTVGSEKTNEDKDCDTARNDNEGSISRTKESYGQLTDDTTDRTVSSPTAGTGGEISEDVRTPSSDTDRTSSDDLIQEDVEVESDSDSSTQSQPKKEESKGDKDTVDRTGMVAERETAATETVTEDDTQVPVCINEKRDENDNTDKDVTFITNAGEA